MVLTALAFPHSQVPTPCLSHSIWLLGSLGAFSALKKKKKKKKPAQLLVNLIYFLINCEEWGVFPPSISKPVHL